MGNEGSAPASLNLPFSSPYEEKFYHKFVIQEEKPIRSAVRYNVQSTHLMQILTTNPGIIPNEEEAIRYLIDYNDVADDSDKFMQNYFNEYEISRTLMRIRLIERNIKPIQRESQDITHLLITSLQLIFDEFSNQLKDQTLLTQTIDKLSKLKLPVSISPPIKEYEITNKSYTGVIPIPSLVTRGIVSNGKFLFLLASDATIHIFPIVENGALLTPFTKTLIFQQNITAQLSLTSTGIVAHCQKRYHFSTFMIISDDEEKYIPESVENEKFAEMIVTDGAVRVRVDSNLIAMITHIDTDEIIHQVQLHKGQEELNSEAAELLTPHVLANCPAETNGSSLLIFIKIDDLHCLLRHFSLITGEHIHDEVIETEGPIVGCYLDLVHHLHWIAFSIGGRIIIKSFEYLGSNDPYIFRFMPPVPLKSNKVEAPFNNFLRLLNNLLFGNLSISPYYVANFKKEEFMDIIYKFCPILDQVQRSNKPLLRVFVQIYLFTIGNSLNQLTEISEVRQTFEYITSHIIQEYSKFNIAWAVYLIMQLSDTNIIPVTNVIKATQLCDPVLAKFLLSNLTYHKYFGFYETFNKEVENSLSTVGNLSNLPPNIYSLLLIQQLVVIRESLKIFLEDSYASFKVFSNKKASFSSIDTLHQLMTLLFHHFTSDAHFYKEYIGLQESIINHLYINFTYLIWGITENNAVSQMALPILSAVPNSLLSYFKYIKMDPFSNELAREMFITIGFTFGLVAATLIQGGRSSAFEDKYKWLVVPNLDLVDSPEIINQILESKEIDNDFYLNGQQNMTTLYSFWKKLFNKKLHDEVLRFERLFMCLLFKALNCKEIFEKSLKTKKLDPSLTKPLDVMFSTRNTIITMIRENKPIDKIFEKGRTMLKMKMKFEENEKDEIPKLLAAYLLSDESADTVLHLIQSQKVRLALTDTGFNLVRKIFQMNINTIFNQTVSSALSTMDSFESLSAIVRYSKDADTEFVYNFLNMVMATNNSRLLLIVHKMLHSHIIPNEQIGKFLSPIFQNLMKRPSDTQLFGLVIHFVSFIPDAFDYLLNLLPENEELLPIHVFLINDTIDTTKECSMAVYKKIVQLALVCKSTLARNTINCLRSAMRFVKIRRDQMKRDLTLLFEHIGKSLLDMHGLALACEYVSFFRQLIVDNEEPAKIVKEIIKSVTPDKGKDFQIISVFAVLGGNIEVLRPYCTVNIRKSLEVNCIAITDASKTDRVYFELPFSSETPANPAGKFLITPVASIDFNPTLFPEFDYVLSFYKKCTERLDSILNVIYITSLSCYLQVKDNCTKFVNSDCFEDCSKRLSKNMNPFDNIQDTINKIMEIYSKNQVDPYSDFGRLLNKQFNSFVLMSPKLKQKSVAEVMIRTNGAPFKGYIGIVEDSINEFVLYQIVHFPSCLVYPSKSQLKHINLENEFTFKVDEDKKQVNINGTTFRMPKFARSVKIIVSPDENTTIDTIMFTNPTDCLDLEKPIEPMILGFNDEFNENPKLYEFPKWTDIDVKQARDKLKNLPELPRFEHLVPDELDENHRIMPAPNNMPIHALLADSLSKFVIDNAANHYIAHLSTQRISVLIMRVVMNGYAHKFPIPSMMRLFSMILLELEPFSFIDLHRGIFPFNLEVNILTPHAPVNKLNFGLSQNALLALNEITQIDGFRKHILNYTANIAAMKELHLLTNTLIPLVYFPYGSTSMTTLIDGSYFNADKLVIAFPNFNKSKNRDVRVNSNKVSFPLCSETSQITIDFNDVSYLQSSLAALCVEKWYTSWAFGTVYELLLLLRTLHMINIDKDSPVFTRSIIIDLLLTQSPFSWIYIKKLLPLFSQNFLTQDIVTKDYLCRLLLLASFMEFCNNKVDFEVTSFFIQEQRAIISNLPYILAPYFPEFLTQNIQDVPTELGIRVPIPSLSFTPTEKDINSTVLLYQNLISPRQSFEGYPFYEIIPLWLAIVSLRDPDYPKFAKVEYIKQGDKQIIIKNKKKALCIINIDLRKIQSEIPGEPPKDFNIQNSYLELIVGHKKTTLHGQELPLKYKFSDEEVIVNLCGDIIVPNVVFEQVSDEDTFAEVPLVQPNLFKEKFLEDMKIFMMKWSPAQTRELVQCFPKENLLDSDFSSLVNYALKSPLIMSFPENVVLLYSLLIHRFNYIWFNFKKIIPETFLNSFMDFLSVADTTKDFLQQVVVSNFIAQVAPDIKLDRRSAQFLVLNGEGDFRKSIIAQFTRQITKLSPSRLQLREKPWHVSFVGESAIDAGGPRKELFIELANSIFQPTSHLFIQSPNGRNHCGSFRDAYVPSTTLGKDSYDQYKAIGTFLGIIIRNGFPQDIPFAPFIWKHLAGDLLQENDILMVDEQVKTLFDRLRQSKNDLDFTSRFQQKWTYISWTGEILDLPSQHHTEFVTGESVEQFIDEFVQARINEISQYLDLIRSGFAINIGFETHPMMNATLIALLVQGSNVITTAQLRQITSFDGFNKSNEYVISNYWAAVDRMSNEQRSLLLKFVTTLTRFPNKELNPTFHIQIKSSGGTEDRLPHAQTCFCRLHLPNYTTPDIAYNKISLAIEICTTMENM